MKTRVLARLALCLLLLQTMLGLRADGFIIIHDPHLPPRPLPPPHREPWLPPVHHVFAPLEVAYHHVTVAIRDQVATTTVEQEFYNPNNSSLEGTYMFPLPPGAQIDKFSMRVGDKMMEAELLPADKARKIYEDIVRQMRDPALLEYAGRDAFKVRIFPIEPRSRKPVKLTYTQVLKGENGLVGYRYPLNTERFSAKPIPSTKVDLSIESPRPLKSIYSPSHDARIVRETPTRATVKLELKDAKPDTDFQLYFAAEKGPLTASLLAQKTEEDGHFLLILTPDFAPQKTTILPKDIVFVLDTSGSMAGPKLEQAKKALTFCVENLNDKDRFTVIRFSTDTEAVFQGLAEATKESRQKARDFIAGLRSTGGTAIAEALATAMAIRTEKSERPFVIVFLTDGQPTVGETRPDPIVADVTRLSGGHVRVFCFGIGHDVNTHLLDRITEATRAYSQYVLPEEDLEVKLSSFYEHIQDPVLAELKVTFPDGVKVTQLYPHPLPDLFRGDQLILAGRYSGQGVGEVIVEGRAAGENRRLAFKLDFPKRAADQEFVPRLWATRRVGCLLDEIRLRGESAELRDEVTELARKYGIVTPYTAYLIHEDEARRQVPLAMQSVPQLQVNEAVRAQAGDAYMMFRKADSGVAGVAAARYGQAQKSADRVGDALSVGRMEAGRAMAAAPKPTTRSLVSASSPTMPAPAAAPMVAAPAQPTVTAAGGEAGQSRYVGGRTFYQNGNQWIDALVQKSQKLARVELKFGSDAYFELMAKNPEIKPWLALGQNVQFVHGNRLYVVAE